MNNINLKDAFSEHLIEVAKADKRIIVADPDVARSTKMLAFAKAFPERFYELGVAEQNTLGLAAGLASEGNVVFAVAFSPFISMRPIEMTRTAVAYPGHNVKIVGQYAGFTDGKDGATHESFEDVGMMRSIPTMVVISPSDPVMTRAMIEPVIAQKGPTYIRIDNEECDCLYPQNFKFEIGKAYPLKEGSDITLAAYGSAVHRILKAARELEKENISAEVLDFATIKPIDKETLLNSLQKTGRLITLEDHNIYGGLASAAAEAVLGSGIAPRFIGLGMQDIFGMSGNIDPLREYFGLATADVIFAAKALMSR